MTFQHENVQRNEYPHFDTVWPPFKKSWLRLYVALHNTFHAAYRAHSSFIRMTFRIAKIELDVCSYPFEPNLTRARVTWTTTTRANLISMAITAYYIWSNTLYFTPVD